MDLRGRTAVISGGSSGIGAATAREMARRGAKVVLVARTAEALEVVAEEIRTAGGEATTVAVDLGDHHAVADAAERIRGAIGVPDVIVNNAGAGRWLAVEETSPEEAAQMMAAPYFAAFHLTRAFLPDLIARGSGHVVNVNSPASLLPIPGASGYSAARAALRSFSLTLRLELRGTGVGVTHFVAGKVSSPYFENNPGVEKRVPSINRIISVLSPEDCARHLAKGVERGRREVVVPFLLRTFYWLYQVAPWLVLRVVWVTAWKRPA